MTDSPVRTYVLDTSVLLSDPWASTRFAEHEVVVPLVVISELEAKRHHHELGWFARQHCGCSTICGSSMDGWISRFPLGRGRHAACRTEPQRPDGAARGFRTDTNDRES